MLDHTCTYSDMCKCLKFLLYHLSKHNSSIYICTCTYTLMVFEYSSSLKLLHVICFFQSSPYLPWLPPLFFFFQSSQGALEAGSVLLGMLSAKSLPGVSHLLLGAISWKVGVLFPMTDPWDERYIYLPIYHENQPFILGEWLIFMVN